MSPSSVLKCLCRDDADSNLKGLIGGEFGGQKLKSTEEAQAAQAIRAAGIALDGDGEHVELGRQEIIRIPEHCPSCGAVGESLTALTDIPHFKEVRYPQSLPHNFHFPLLSMSGRYDWCAPGDHHGLHVWGVRIQEQRGERRGSSAHPWQSGARHL